MSSACAIDMPDDWLSSCFVTDSAIGGSVGEPARHLRRRGRELVGRDDPVHDADALGRVGVDDLAEQRELLRLVQADQPGQQPRAAEVDRDAALHEDLAEARSFRREHDVARQREVAPGAHRDAVHRRERRLRELVQAERAAADAAQRRERHAGDLAAAGIGLGEVGAGAEAVALRR